MVNPLVSQQIEDLTIDEGSDSTTIDLMATFDDPSTTGQIARFEFADNVNDGGVIDVLLFDQEGVGAPATVENFLNYVEDGDYDDTIIHRSIPNFIIQGGGFDVNNASITSIPSDDPVVNEFSLERSNVRGTIAMAKLGGNPDSATNGWFFNLVDNNDPDNPDSLDNQNGGFTAFGEILNDEGFETIDAIASLDITDGDPVPDLRTFDNLPITDTADPINTEDLVFLESVTSLSEDELEFSVVNNSNEELVETSINDGELVLDYVDGESGEATITLEATNLLGESVEDSFVVTVDEPPVDETPIDETPIDETPIDETPIDETPIDETPDLDLTDSTVFRFLDPDTGIHFYADSEAERDELVANEPGLVSENLGYRTVNPVAGDAQEVFSFLNQDTGAYLYTVDENEREFIEDNLDNYTQESDSFSVFAVEPDNLDTIPVYRFLNTSTGAHFYTPSVAERDAIEDNLPNYNSEGIAFYAFEAGE